MAYDPKAPRVTPYSDIWARFNRVDVLAEHGVFMRAQAEDPGAPFLAHLQNFAAMHIIALEENCP